MIEQLKFGDVEIENEKFHSWKKVINIDEVDNGKICVSDEFANGKNKGTDAKYFIGYKTGQKIRQLLITLPQISGCPNEVEKT